MEDKKYNGWTNYATWRIQLELIDERVEMLAQDIASGEDIAWDNTRELGDYLEEYVNEVLDEEVQGDKSIQNLVRDYANAFISEVNWYELAEHAQERLLEAREEAKATK